MISLKSPFKFLDSYTKDDREIFFGREREIEELYHRVFESKIMLVYGVSGTGKSSLVHCGLANKFQDTDWLPIVIRRSGNIMESMATGIKAASITEQQNKFFTPDDFRKGVRSLYLDHYKPVFFIYDQFEELFIFGDKEERRSFIQIVKTITDSELQCRMIFVMREEYMAWVTEFEKFIPTFFSNRVRIEKMSHRNALEAIKGPCKIFNINLEEGFAETLLEKLSPGSEDVELTYLQVFLDKIYRLSSGFVPPSQGGKEGGPLAAGGEPKVGPMLTPEPKGGLALTSESKGDLFFTLSLLQKTGNVSDLLSSFLDEQISLMEDPDAAMAILKAFVSGKGTKRPANENEIIDDARSFGKQIIPEKAKEVVQSFVKLRVLRDKDENGRYELRHDALAEKVYDKFTIAEKELLEIRQMIENAYQYFLKRNILLTNDDLNYISGRDSMLNLNNELLVFLEESRKLQKARIKTVKRLTLASVVIFILMMVILNYYAYTKIEEVRADYAAIKSINQVPHPVEAFRIAGKATLQSPGVLQKEAMLRSFNSILHSPTKDSIMVKISEGINISFEPAPVKIKSAGCSLDNRYIFGYGDSLLMIWNMEGKLERKILTSGFPVIDMKISDDGWYVGAVTNDSTLTIWHAAGNMQFSIKIPYNILNTKNLFKFLKKNQIISVSQSHDAVIYDMDGNIIQELDRHHGRVNALAISSDNNFIATASSDKTINIWYLNNNSKKYDLYNTLDWHRDTVWSVAFSNKQLTVISGGADSMLYIGNINNDHCFDLRSKTGFSNVEFTPSDLGFIFTCYYKDNDSYKYDSHAYSYANPRIEINNKYSLSGKIGEGGLKSSGYGFSNITLSKNDEYYLCGGSEDFFLIDNQMFLKFDNSPNNTMLEIKGSYPFFTSDSRYILSINGNTFISYLVDLEEIVDIYNRHLRGIHAIE